MAYTDDLISDARAACDKVVVVAGHRPATNILEPLAWLIMDRGCRISRDLQEHGTKRKEKSAMHFKVTDSKSAEDYECGEGAIDVAF